MAADQRAHILARALPRAKKCEECGAPHPVAHHDDYTKPLKVRWLCRSCHRQFHIKIHSEGQALPGEVERRWKRVILNPRLHVALRVYAIEHDRRWVEVLEEAVIEYLAKVERVDGSPRRAQNGGKRKSNERRATV